MQNVSTFPLHVQAAGYSTSVYGALQALNGVIVVLLELPITSWTGRRSRTRMIALGTLLIGLSLRVPDRRPKSIPALAAMVLIWTLGEIIASPVASAFVADRSPEHTRGRYQASLGVMFALGAIVGPTHRDPHLRVQPRRPVDRRAASPACSRPPSPWPRAAIRPRSWRLTLPGRSG